MKYDFLYMAAIIDWYSRCVVGRKVDDTMDTAMVINVCNKVFKVVKPLIIIICLKNLNTKNNNQLPCFRHLSQIRPKKPKYDRCSVRKSCKLSA